VSPELFEELLQNPFWQEAALECAGIGFFPMIWLVIEVVYARKAKESPSSREQLSFWRTYLAMISLIAIVVVFAITIL
jgi:hypothetical protein